MIFHIFYWKQVAIREMNFAQAVSGLQIEMNLYFFYSDSVSCVIQTSKQRDKCHTRSYVITHSHHVQDMYSLVFGQNLRCRDALPFEKHCVVSLSQGIYKQGGFRKSTLCIFTC